MRHTGRAGLILATLIAAAPAGAATVPFADTEDATLGAVEVGAGRFHPILSMDLRNGDYARGTYDDDRAGLGRVPLHVAFGFAAELRANAAGEGDLFLIGQSSNGFHAPDRRETTSPRGWYESNNLLGLAWRPAEGLSAAVAYTIKTSPNAVSATTHEASLSAAFSRDEGSGRLRPRLAVTVRPRGANGIYTIAGVAPETTFGDGENAPTLSLPVTVGVGWGGFYGPGSGSRTYASGGLSLSQPVAFARAKASISAELLALVRDDGLRRLDAPNGTTATVVPLGTLTFRVGW
ncbi:hypothetical protein [Sphingomonas solaris]|uniref:Transporter n=1 Tax=Alterirhizorhabdus solaris TaxID=2529389 RepID=A0A558QYD8_9SPHN|nr:hypothetical protein [Sphingomonas solaris]TVV72125.1 hypothetical protein FOY91_15285 [Sphingomonas solaris]